MSTTRARALNSADDANTMVDGGDRSSMGEKGCQQHRGESPAADLHTDPLSLGTNNSTSESPRFISPSGPQTPTESLPPQEAFSNKSFKSSSPATEHRQDVPKLSSSSATGPQSPSTDGTAAHPAPERASLIATTAPRAGPPSLHHHASPGAVGDELPTFSSPLSSPPSSFCVLSSPPLPEPPSGRPKRKRGAPERYSDGEEMRREKKAAATVAEGGKERPKRRQAGASSFDPSFLLQNKRSMLARVDLRKIINDDRAWASLSAEQRRVVLRLFNQTPASTLATVPEDLPNIPAQLLARSTALRTDLRLYQEDLAGGRMDPVRRRRAEAAAKERAEGRFDDWKERERELWWGQKMEGGG